MSLTIKQLIEQNNEKRKQLTPENKTYYEDLLVYIRTNKFKDERATEEVLLNMLNELLEAQQDGKSAEELYGTSPKQFADGIIQSLPRESMKSSLEFSLEILFTLFGWLLVVWGIWPIINQEDPSIHFGTLTVSAVMLISGLLLIVYLFYSITRKHAFSDMKKKNASTWLIGIVVGVLFLVGFLLNFLIEPFGPLIKISYYTPFGLGCFLLLASYILKKSRE